MIALSPHHLVRPRLHLIALRLLAGTAPAPLRATISTSGWIRPRFTYCCELPETPAGIAPRQVPCGPAHGAAIGPGGGVRS